MPINVQQLRSAFADYDRRVIVTNVKVGCLIGVMLMPVGTILDWFVYPPEVYPGVWVAFVKLRLLCSLLIGFFWFAVVSPVGHKHPRPLGVLLAMFPSFFISVMIYMQGGSESLYYAGLNLVLLVIGFVLHWTLAESAIAVSLVVAMYVAACALHGPISKKEFVNNMYFLTLTGIIVMVGSYVHSRWRFREFTLRYELDQNRQELETTNEQLNKKTGELEASNVALSQKKGELEVSNEQLNAIKSELEVSNSELTNQKFQVEQTLLELRRTQAQLVQKEKEELLNQVSAGILHDVRNLLAPVTNYLFKLKKLTDSLPDERRANYLETLGKIERPMNAARAVFDTIERYAYADPQRTHECSVRSLIEDALNLVRGKSDEAGITVQCEVDPEFVVLGQPLDLTMVFKNLLDNSIDALTGKAFASESPSITIESRAEEQRWFLVFRDNGTGMKPEDRSKIFEPYFTTKPMGKGTGLGLANCKRTMKGLGGDISVRSEPGQFAEFTLEFPRHMLALGK